MGLRRFPFRKPQSRARARLVCLPFAGGGAAAFRGWQELLGPHIEVCALELPGRGGRLGEAPHRVVDRAVDEIERSVTPLLDLPIALFGHSLGARLAFECSKRLGSAVHHLFVSACPGPDVSRDRKTRFMNDAEFKRELALLGGTPAAALADDELMGLLLPMLRADFELAETYLARDSAPAPCALTVFAGSTDEGISLEDAKRWRNFASAGYRFVVVPGGHFFLEPQRETVTAEIRRDLATVSALA